MAEQREFDESKDRELWDCGVVYEDRYTRLSVAIFAYGERGRPKVQIRREKEDRGEWRFGKLGRMSAQEFAVVVEATKIAFEAVERGDVQEAPVKMDKEYQPPW